MEKYIYHISGHLDVTMPEFAEHYTDNINRALRAGAAFVIGDAKGADKLAQDYLWSQREYYPDLKVTIYHMFGKPRNNPGFPTVCGFHSDAERDAAMTAASTDDIAWVRPGREDSGTAKNLKRRLGGYPTDPAAELYTL